MLDSLILLAIAWAMICRSSELPDEGHYKLAARLYLWGALLFGVIALVSLAGGVVSYLINLAS